MDTAVEHRAGNAANMQYYLKTEKESQDKTAAVVESVLYVVTKQRKGFDLKGASCSSRNKTQGYWSSTSAMIICAIKIKSLSS